MEGKQQMDVGSNGEVNKKRLLLEVARGSLMWLLIWVVDGMAAVILLALNLSSISGNRKAVGESYGWIITAFYCLVIAVRDHTRQNRAVQHGLQKLVAGSETVQRIVVAFVLFVISVIGFAFAVTDDTLSSLDVINCCFVFDSVIGALLGSLYMANNRNDAENYRIQLGVPDGEDIENVQRPNQMVVAAVMDYKGLLLDVIRSSWAWLWCWVIKSVASIALTIVNLVKLDTAGSARAFIGGINFLTPFIFGWMLVNIRDYLRKDRAERYKVGNPNADLTSVQSGPLKGRIVASTIALCGIMALFIASIIVAELSKTDLLNSIFAEVSLVSSTLGLLFVFHNRTDADIYQKL
jgi:hypothetical protein